MPWLIIQQRSKRNSRWRHQIKRVALIKHYMEICAVRRKSSLSENWNLLMKPLTCGIKKLCSHKLRIVRGHNFPEQQAINFFAHFQTISKSNKAKISSKLSSVIWAIVSRVNSSDILELIQTSWVRLSHCSKPLLLSLKVSLHSAFLTL